MKQVSSERHVYQDKEPMLYRYLEELVQNGHLDTEVDGVDYFVTFRKDADWIPYFMLVPFN